VKLLLFFTIDKLQSVNDKHCDLTTI